MDRFWLPWAGVPGQFVSDLGPEFRSDEFVAWCEGHGAKVWHSSVEAPWQNGLAERAGAIFKGIFRKVVSDHQCSTAVELDFAAATTCVAMNDRINESGYSPSQWVIGRCPRRAGSLLNNRVADHLPEHDAADVHPDFMRRSAFLASARLAQLRLDVDVQLRRAELARARSQPGSLRLGPGDVVYFYRETKAKNSKLLLKRWHGPATVIGIDGTSAVYVEYRGNTTKCAPEHVRRASPLEELAAGDWAAELDALASFDIDELDFGADEYPDTVEPPMTGGDAAPVPAPPEPPPTEPPTRSALDNAGESFARRLAGQLPESAEPLRERLLEVDARHAALPPAPDPPPPDARRVRFDSGVGDLASSSAASSGPQDNSQRAPKQARVSIFQDASSRPSVDSSADVSAVTRHEVFEALSDQRICDALVSRAIRDNHTDLLDRLEAPPDDVLVHLIAEIVRDLRAEGVDSPYLSDHGSPKGSDELLKHHPDAPLTEPEVNVTAKGGRREIPWRDVSSLD